MNELLLGCPLEILKAWVRRPPTRLDYREKMHDRDIGVDVPRYSCYFVHCMPLRMLNVLEKYASSMLLRGHLEGCITLEGVQSTPQDLLTSTRRPLVSF